MTTHVLHEVVFPENADIDVVPLYWDVDQASFAAPKRGGTGGSHQREHVAVGTVNVGHILDRRRARVPGGTRASTATYFNAFPASYWRRWTYLSEVTLVVQVSGSPGRVSVYKSTPDGRLQRCETATCGGPVAGQVHELRFQLPLASFGDGGWYWFDLIAGTDDLVLESARYESEAKDEGSRGSATIAITTFDRPDWCVSLLGQLAVAAEEISEIDVVHVVDQGQQRVAEAPGFADTAGRLGDQLVVTEQANLGGSGGFARGMWESTEAGRSSYVLLLDDDVQIERESIRRALVFADLCRRPTIVGGQMLSASARASLHSMGEIVDRGPFRWGPADHVEEDHDFGVQSLRATPWMHRRIDVDYNAWWMCLIPMKVVKDVGLPLPLFIKWDDAEYGLRAGDMGFPTVSLPGVASWHVPWTGKDDTLDWQAYFHQRNRLVVALLHSPHAHGGRVIHESFAHQVKHILSMQYSTAELRLRAAEDVLRGPGHLHPSLRSARGDIEDVRRTFRDAQALPNVDDFPAPRNMSSQVGSTSAPGPRNNVGVLVTAALGGLRQLTAVPPPARQRPDAVVPALDAAWWRLSALDSAVVSTRDGTGATWYQRDRRTSLDLLRRSLEVHRRLIRQWPTMSTRYRAALAEVTGSSTWARTLDPDG